MLFLHVINIELLVRYFTFFFGLNVENLVGNLHSHFGLATCHMPTSLVWLAFSIWGSGQLEQCLTHKRKSINIHWMDEQVSKWVNLTFVYISHENLSQMKSKIEFDSIKQNQKGDLLLKSEEVTHILYPNTVVVSEWLQLNVTFIKPSCAKHILATENMRKIRQEASRCLLSGELMRFWCLALL